MAEFFTLKFNTFFNAFLDQVLQKVLQMDLKSLEIDNIKLLIAHLNNHILRMLSNEIRRRLFKKLRLHLLIAFNFIDMFGFVDPFVIFFEGDFSPDLMLLEVGELVVEW